MVMSELTGGGWWVGVISISNVLNLLALYQPWPTRRYLTEQIFQHEYFYALITINVYCIFQQLKGCVYRFGQLRYSGWNLNVNQFKTCRYVLDQRKRVSPCWSGTIYCPHLQNTWNTNNTPILTSPVNSEVAIMFSTPKLVYYILSSYGYHTFC